MYCSRPLARPAALTALPALTASLAGGQANPETVILVPDTLFRDRPTCPEMVVVPAGTFIMGSPESERGRLGAVYDQEGTAIGWTVIDEVEAVGRDGARVPVVERSGMGVCGKGGHCECALLGRVFIRPVPVRERG